ncbi:MAG: hypothetical protein FWE20_03930 [Defluviitaleaceae bacterium]|nr:hypothetical protein [Defluviitaleaceae bacterium]
MDYNHMISIVTNIYEQDFKKAYSQLGPRGKSGLLRYFFSFYRKWQTSAMIDNTFLTPNNILALINKEYHKKTLTTTVPTIKTFKRFKKFEFREISYTLDCHPVVDDLKTLLTCLSPSFELVDSEQQVFALWGTRANGYVNEKIERELMERLSLQDPFYVSYLMRVAAELGLAVKMPSLYSNKMQVTPKADKMFGGKLSKSKSKEIFSAVTLASTRLAADVIDSFLPTPGIVDARYIRQIIEKPTSSDEIFRFIYDRLGFDFEQIAGIDLNKPIPDEFHDIVSGTFALGAIMAMHLVTVFGVYLRLINPVHIISHNMDRDMIFVRDALASNHDIEIPLFAPCTFFTPTQLGIKLFKLPRDSAMPLPNTPTLSQLIELIENMDDLRKMAARTDAQEDTGSESAAVEDDLKVYEFKVKISAAPSFWKRILFVGDMTLDEFAAFVAYEFFDSPTADYSFHNTQVVNRFTEVSPSSRKPSKRASNRPIRREKDSETTTIDEFLKTCAGDFLLIMRDQGFPPEITELFGGKHEKNEPVRLAVKCMNGKTILHKSFYPRVVGEGKAWAEVSRI